MAISPSDPSSDACLTAPGSLRAQFEIQDSVRGGRHTLVLRGELDMTNADMLEEVLQRLCRDGVTDLVLDLNHLAFMDSTGLRVVLAGYGVCQEHHCKFLIRPGHSTARRLLEVSGTLDILPLDES